MPEALLNVTRQRRSDSGHAGDGKGINNYLKGNKKGAFDTPFVVKFEIINFNGIYKKDNLTTTLFNLLV